MVGTI